MQKKKIIKQWLDLMPDDECEHEWAYCEHNCHEYCRICHVTKPEDQPEWMDQLNVLCTLYAVRQGMITKLYDFIRNEVIEKMGQEILRNIRIEQKLAQIQSVKPDDIVELVLKKWRG